MKKLLTILVLIMLIISFFQITSMYALYRERIQGEYNTLLGAWEIKVNAADVTSSGQNETFTIADNQLEYVSSEYIQAGKIAPNGQAYFDIVIDPSNEYADTTDSTGQTKYTAYTDVSIIYKIDVKTDITSTSTDPSTELKNAIELVSIENYFGQGDDGQTNKSATTTISEDGKIVNQTTGLKTLKDGNSYTSVIPVSLITQGYKNYIRLYFRWNNVTETSTETVVEDGVEKQVEKQVELNNDEDTLVGSTENAKISIPLQINLKQYTGEVIGNES